MHFHHLIAEEQEKEREMAEADGNTIESWNPTTSSKKATTEQYILLDFV